jgi:hypothetical protein
MGALKEESLTEFEKEATDILLEAYLTLRDIDIDMNQPTNRRMRFYALQGRLHTFLQYSCGVDATDRPAR